jgi:formamidopyrimidine-DNA glycosylase
MPELPDITVYVEALQEVVAGRTLRSLEVRSPFVLRTVSPGPADYAGRAVTGVSRIGKRIVLAFEGEHHAVIHLMIAGRLHWRAPNASTGGKMNLLAFRFTEGALILTEASQRKRASLHLLEGREALTDLDPGGIEPLAATPAAFAEALRREPHTVKRALTDPRLLSGIGNAYSDEILHRARLSPFKLTTQMADAEMERLRTALVEVIGEWTDRLRSERKGRFPEKVTAFRPEMAVHGRFGLPCPTCGAPVQRIAYADNEANYCAECQTGGKLLADRALSRLLHEDWPRSLTEMEEMRAGHRAALGGPASDQD